MIVLNEIAGFESTFRSGSRGASRGSRNLELRTMKDTEISFRGLGSGVVSVKWWKSVSASSSRTYSLSTLRRPLYRRPLLPAVHLPALHSRGVATTGRLTRTRYEAYSGFHDCVVAAHPRWWTLQHSGGGAERQSGRLSRVWCARETCQNRLPGRGAGTLRSRSVGRMRQIRCLIADLPRMSALRIGSPADASDAPLQGGPILAGLPRIPPTGRLSDP